MELTPRTFDGDVDVDEAGEGTDAPRRPRSRRRWLPLAIVGVVVVALGFLVVKGLSEATVYFLNADEAVERREELGDKRFRLQGEVVDQGVATDDGVDFDVTYNDVTVAVRHVGDPPDMFEPGIPVVLEGSWDPSGEFFASDHMLIKHDADYESREDYDERMNDADQGGEEDGDSSP